MEKEKIEAKDKEFRDKLQQMRTNLATRQVQATEKEDDNRMNLKTAIPVLLFLILAVYFGGKMMQGDEPESTSSQSEPQVEEHRYPVPPDKTETGGTVAKTETADEQASPAASPDEPFEGSDESTAETRDTGDNLLASEEATPDAPLETEPETGTEAESESAPEERTSSPSVSLEEQPPAVEPDSAAEEDSQYYEPEEIETEPSETETAETETPETVETETDSRETEEIEPEPSTPQSESFRALYGTRIDQYNVCSDVRARQCVSPQSSFSLQQRRNPHFWMDVRSNSVPYELKHVYYREGQKYVEVPLEIQYPRMRTWSYITLGDSTPPGLWHVQIETDNGTVLGRAEFTITAGE